MELVSIRCLSCEQGWVTVAALSFYEQQARESCPCPSCGAYTLSVADPQAKGAVPAR